MPYKLVASSGAKDVWVFAHHPGMPELGPFVLPDGRDAYQLIRDGRTTDLPFVPRFVQTHGRRWGDLLWTTEQTKIASQLFVDALEGFSGWHDFDVEVLDRHGRRREGYRGFAVDGTGSESDVWNYTGGQNSWFAVSDAVIEALRGRGVTEASLTRMDGAPG
ncbi:hypothetical protein [Isoptericola sp. NPDC019482]|uniref:hypothetical protein n=1 Tax=Isoptericola sp. NPDC019482 TaxID=3154688 RepID=UPI0034894B43